MTAAGRQRTLLPLLDQPHEDPAGWKTASGLKAAAGSEAGTIALIRLPTIASGDRTDHRGATWVRFAAAIERLVEAGLEPAGHVSLAFGTRPVATVFDEIERWTDLGVHGIFFDHAPATRRCLRSVEQAVRAARRRDCATVILNPGMSVDPIYRRLDATICTFEGRWDDYIAWSGEQTQDGDGHLVFGVPPSLREAAHVLIASRRAGLILVTERSSAYGPNTASRAGHHHPAVPLLVSW